MTWCMCDKPTCDLQPCKQLREYRVTHRVMSEILKLLPAGCSVQDLLDFIETECWVLCK